MSNEKPYLTFSPPAPRPPAHLFKRGAERKAARMRERTIAAHREMMDRLADVRILALGSRFSPFDCGGVPCEWIYRDNQPVDRCILYIHGGSWVYGNLHTARPVGLLLNARTDLPVLVMQYRLAPEHPFPAALHDCATVYRYLLRRSGVAVPAIFGDSAGGNLTLALMHLLRSHGLPLPAALGLASPAPDLTENAALMRQKPDQLYARHNGQEVDTLSLYCKEGNREDPLLSPIYGRLDDLPPTLIHTGQDEVLYLDCDAFAQKAYNAGVDIQLKIWRDMFHDFTIVGNTLKESRQSLDEFAAFFCQHLAHTPQEA